MLLSLFYCVMNRTKYARNEYEGQIRPEPSPLRLKEMSGHFNRAHFFIFEERLRYIC